MTMDVGAIVPLPKLVGYGGESLVALEVRDEL